MKNRSFYLGMLIAAAVIALIYFLTEPPANTEHKSYDEMIDSLTIFEDIGDLDYLEPYVTEKVDTDRPEHVDEVYAAKVNYKGVEYSVLAYSFDSEENAWLYFCSGFSLPIDEIAHYHVLESDVKHIGRAEVTGRRAYYLVTTKNTRRLPDFICFMNENMNVPVYQGD